jgi:hypothetical protein
MLSSLVTNERMGPVMYGGKELPPRLLSHKPLGISVVKGVTDIGLMAAVIEERLNKLISGHRLHGTPRYAISMRRCNVRLIKFADSTDVNSHDHGSIGIVGYPRLAISFSSI